MKLVIITGSVAYEENIKAILKKTEVDAYSFQAVSGYLHAPEAISAANWFASDENETASILFYAFIKEEKSELLFTYINNFNKEQETSSHIHIALLPIEKSN